MKLKGLRKCSHYRGGGLTTYMDGIFEVKCYRCSGLFYLPIDQKSPKWFTERLNGILTAISIEEYNLRKTTNADTKID